VIVHLLVFVTW